jgi:hypothetical protein
MRPITETVQPSPENTPVLAVKRPSNEPPVSVPTVIQKADLMSAFDPLRTFRAIRRHIRTIKGANT